MTTIEDVNREYEEAIRPAKDRYNGGMQAAVAVYNMELTKINDKFKADFGEIGRMKREVIESGDSDQLTAVEELERELMDKLRQAHQDADRRLRQAQAPIKAEYGRATQDAQRKRWEGLSKARR